MTCLHHSCRSVRSEDSFVNLGARNGLADDPLQFLLREPRHVEFALAVEMDPERPGTPGQRGKLRCRKTPWFPEEHLQMMVFPCGMNICSVQMVAFPQIWDPWDVGGI